MVLLLGFTEASGGAVSSQDQADAANETQVAPTSCRGGREILRGICMALTEGKWRAVVRVEGALYAWTRPLISAALRAGPPGTQKAKGRVNLIM